MNQIHEFDDFLILYSKGMEGHDDILKLYTFYWELFGLQKNVLHL